ncbi:hypothetical protein BaRGS_00029193 [Batillaria attramentaria]|uniref:Uncharacterized protein n=1 Tax=Batillaria attramentaria TaxID=370345 RepID=A0ABD0JWX6_9CAEN
MLTGSADRLVTSTVDLHPVARVTTDIVLGMGAAFAGKCDDADSCKQAIVICVDAHSMIGQSSEVDVVSHADSVNEHTTATDNGASKHTLTYSHAGVDQCLDSVSGSGMSMNKQVNVCQGVDDFSD